MAHITNTATGCIRMFLCNWSMSYVELAEIEHNIPRPWFDNEEHAWDELMQCLAYIDGMPIGVQSEANYRFYRTNLAALFLKEAPNYHLLWLLALPDRLNIALQCIQSNEVRNKVHNDCIDAARYIDTYKGSRLIALVED